MHGIFDFIKKKYKNLGKLLQNHLDNINIWSILRGLYVSPAIRGAQHCLVDRCIMAEWPSVRGRS